MVAQKVKNSVSTRLFGAAISALLVVVLIVSILSYLGFTGLKSDYDAINSKYLSLQASSDRLQTSYDSLVADYNNLLYQYNNLSAQYFNFQSGLSTGNFTVVNLNTEMVLYATYSLAWGQESFPAYTTLISGGGKLNVENFSSMTVDMEFENVTSQIIGTWDFDAFWSPMVHWSYPNSTTYDGELLSFSVVDVGIGPGLGVTETPLAVYSIKAPYLELEPSLINYWDVQNEYGYNATATCKIYLFLSHNAQTPADFALEAQEWAAHGQAAVTSSIGFGPYSVKGYSQISIAIESTVNCDVWIYDPFITTAYTYENLNVQANQMVQRTYNIQSSSLGIYCTNPVPGPWQVKISCYLKP
jgi:hypothetical protein